MKKVVWTLLTLLLALAAYLSLWPVPVEPVSWQAPAAPGYVGVHAPNTRLSGLQMIALGVHGRKKRGQSTSCWRVMACCMWRWPAATSCACSPMAPASRCLPVPVAGCWVSILMPAAT